MSEPNVFDITIAYLKKMAGFLSDPRTIAAAVSIYTTFRLLGIVTEDTVTEEQITLLLSTAAGAAVALAAVVAALAALVVPLIVLQQGWTTRPSRGVGPWISK